MGRSAVRITADTNVLVRAAVRDDPLQAKVAADMLARAELIAVPLPVLCEFVWVLLSRYGRGVGEIAASIRDLADSANVQLDRPAARGARSGERLAHEPLVQARRARRADASGKAGLHPAGERRTREHDDDAVSADRRTRGRGAAARCRAHRAAAAAT